MPDRPRVAIIGVGLIGGSIGLALRERNLAEEVVGVGRGGRAGVGVLADRQRGELRRQETVTVVSGYKGSASVKAASLWLKVPKPKARMRCSFTRMPASDRPNGLHSTRRRKRYTATRQPSVKK